MVTDAPAWVFEELDKWMRSFFWAGKDKVHDGQCLVAWNSVCKPTWLGGLGVRNMQLQGLSLRVRWEWLRRTDPERPWQGLPMAVDKEARAVFDSLVHIEVGMGNRVLFWRDRWIHDFAVKDIAPYIYALVDTRTINHRTVEDGLQNDSWLHDISGVVNFGGHLQLLHLNLAISTVNRVPLAEDSFSWPADPSGGYTAKSTYLRLCSGTERVPYAACIWKSWALLKCKFFAWLAVQHRIWTSDRRARHGLQDAPSACY
uniref:Reverse transcriptase zinc-binding domain-containing protein n=1 Tax=Triticum urartu TaxID=4572 RepID=A0A8R7UVP5_TRIUA